MWPLAAAAVHRDGESLNVLVKAKLVNWLPWSVLKLPGLPYRVMAS